MGYNTYVILFIVMVGILKKLFRPTLLSLRILSNPGWNRSQGCPLPTYVKSLY